MVCFSRLQILAIFLFGNTLKCECRKPVDEKKPRWCKPLVFQFNYTAEKPCHLGKFIGSPLAFNYTFFDGTMSIMSHCVESCLCDQATHHKTKPTTFLGQLYDFFLLIVLHQIRIGMNRLNQIIVAWGKQTVGINEGLP